MQMRTTRIISGLHIAPETFCNELLQINTGVSESRGSMLITTNGTVSQKIFVAEIENLCLTN